MSTNVRSITACHGCGRTRHIQGRNLCTACYYRFRAAGELDRFPRVTRPYEATLEDYRFLAGQGYTRRQAAERMGITKAALEKAIERTRAPSEVGKIDPTVGPRWNDVSEETTSESTPGQRRWNADRGPRRPIGDERLMSNLNQATDTAPDNPACPICRTKATAATVRVQDKIRTGDYLCGSGHIWQTKWFVGAAA